MSASARKISAHRRIAATDSVLPPDVNPGGTRGEILCAALELFAERGYSGTSVRDICTKADVQATTLYAHFGSKEDVLAEIIRLGHDEHFRRLRSALLETQPEPAKQLAALVRAHVIAHCKYSMLAVVANAELHALPEAKAAPGLAINRQNESLLAEVFERGIRLGIFHVPDSFLAQRAIGSMGMRVAYWYGPDCGRTPEQVAEAYAELALRIAGVRGEGQTQP